MKYLAITKDDMLNGDGLRVVLWVAGCEHHCKGCQNPYSWDYNLGQIFDEKAIEEIDVELEKDYIDGITLSGGDPLSYKNINTITDLCIYIKSFFPTKTIWLYTGYLYEDIKDLAIMKFIDVLVDGEYQEELRNVNTPWTGSDNQRVIDVKKSLENNEVLLYECE